MDRGTLTNFNQIKRRVAKLEELTSERKGELAKYTKRERMLIDKEIDNLRIYFEGIVSMKDLPKGNDHCRSKERRNRG